MSLLSCGIVGLPNAGKSTLFNALMQREIAKVGHHPFTTISPNKGIVNVPDKNLALLAKLVGGQPEIKPVSIEFVDIAGLVKGAADGAGLGNQFLSHIREVDLLLHVLRKFEHPKIPHIYNRIDPVSDLRIVETELILADFEVVDKAIKERLKKTKGNKKMAQELQILEKINFFLAKGLPASQAELNNEEEKTIASFNLLTLKPVIYILNLSEKSFKDSQKNSLLEKKSPSSIILPVCAKLAFDLYQLEKKERQEFLKYYGIKKTGLEKIIKTAYNALDLITFYTIKGGKIITAWSIKRNSTAIEAANKIHSDFGQKFIKVEVITFDNLIKSGSWQKAKEKGLIKLKGKDYIVNNNDVLEFKVAN